MSQQYDRTNTFVLFKNDRMTKETSPNMTGTLNVDGVEYFLDGWTKEGAKGKFIRGKLKRKENQMANLRDELRANSPQAPGRGKGPDPLDEIPFSMEWR